MESVWLQLVITAGTVLTGMFFTIRYAIKETNKGKDGFLKYLERMQEQQLEYYEVKNGHLERISKEFAKTINKNTKAIEKLTAENKSFNKKK